MKQKEFRSNFTSEGWPRRLAIQVLITVGKKLITTGWKSMTMWGNFSIWKTRKYYLIFHTILWLRGAEIVLSRPSSGYYILLLWSLGHGRGFFIRTQKHNWWKVRLNDAWRCYIARLSKCNCTMTRYRYVRGTSQTASRGRMQVLPSKTYHILPNIV